MRYDAIIIGAGLAGLSCALLLARSGRKVLVVEQHTSPAPVMSGFEREGIYFDSGFHYAGGLGAGGALQPLFRHLGLADKLQLFPYDPAGFDSLRFSDGGKEYALPVGFGNIMDYLAEQFPAAKGEISSYLAEIASSWRNSPYLNLEVGLANFGMEPVHGCSLQQRLEVFSPWPQLQSLLSMHSLLYGILPARAPFALNAHVAGSYYHSAHGIVGGGRKLLQALLTLLKDAGVELRCHAEVSQITAVNAVVSGVCLQSGEEFLAPIVIATLNPVLLPELLPDSGLRPAYLRRLKGLQQTSSAYIVFGKSDQSLEFLRRRNRFVQPHPGIFGGIDRPLEERPVYLAGADQGKGNTIAGLIGIIPAHYSEVELWDRVGKQRTSEYHDWKQGMMERVLQMIRCSCPELSRLELLELATPLTLRDYSRAPEGATYGVGRYLGQYNPQAITKLPGLFLAGQGAMLPGLMGSLLSSYLACGSILGHELLLGELKACS